jgi:hypothetical protein
MVNIIQTCKISIELLNILGYTNMTKSDKICNVENMHYHYKICYICHICSLEYKVFCIKILLVCSF